jgi:hypothetical protein
MALAVTVTQTKRFCTQAGGWHSICYNFTQREQKIERDVKSYPAKRVKGAIYIYIYIYTGASESIDDLGHVNCELEERSHTRGNVTLCACACDNGMLGMAVRHYIYIHTYIYIPAARIMNLRTFSVLFVFVFHHCKAMPMRWHSASSSASEPGLTSSTR